MPTDAHMPRTRPFDKDCITDQVVRDLEISIPSCEIAEVPAPGRVIPAGRPTMPIVTPPPPLCMQPCPAPFSYEVIGPLKIRMRQDGFVDPNTYALLSTRSSTYAVLEDSETAPYVVPTVTINVRPNSVLFIYLVYDNTVKALIPQPASTGATDDVGLGMLHTSASMPTTYSAPTHTVMLLHRLDTTGSDAHGLDHVLKCPPGVSNPPRAIAPSSSGAEQMHPFKLFQVPYDCSVAIWPGVVMDPSGTTYDPTLDGVELSAVPTYTAASLGESTSFWLRVEYTTDSEIERVASVTIVRAPYGTRYASNYSVLYVLIGRVVLGGTNSATGRCVMTPWNSLKASIAVSKCDARYTVTPLG